MNDDLVNLKLDNRLDDEETEPGNLRPAPPPTTRPNRDTNTAITTIRPSWYSGRVRNPGTHSS